MTPVKKVLFVILLCVFGSYLQAQTKVALIPTTPELSPLADQVLVAMSKDSDVEFLERSSIETVLSERKLTASGLTSSNLAELGKLIHADLFAIITAKPGKKGAVVSGLIGYDARNGFRLINVMLSEQDAVKQIVKYLRQAQDVIKHPEKQILLSVATVRDVGVPERFKYLEAFIATDLERRLGGISNVIMLERDYLDSVNKEREITEQMFKIAPSSRLFRLEFAPGTSPEIVNLTLRVTDVANKELYRFTLDNCFADTEATAIKTIAAVADYLKVSPPNITISAADEAAHFFAEYQFFSRLGDYAAARRKLDAAIALAPTKLDYRFRMLEFNMLDSRKSNPEIIAALWKNLQICQEIKRDFPAENCLDLYNTASFFIWPDRERLTPEDMAALAEFSNSFRPKYEEQARRLLGNFDPNAEFNSLYDLKRSANYYHQLSMFELYYDFEEWCESISCMAMRNLEQSLNFFRKHPVAANPSLPKFPLEYGVSAKLQFTPSDLALLERGFELPSNLSPQEKQAFYNQLGKSTAQGFTPLPYVPSTTKRTQSFFSQEIERCACYYHLVEAEHTFYSFWNNRQVDRTTAVEKLFRNSGKYIEMALQHPIPAIKFRALRLELWKKTVESNYDEVAFKENMLDYCRKASAIDNELFNNYQLDYGFWKFLGPESALSPNHERLLSLAQQIKQQFSHAGEQLSPQEVLISSISQIADQKAMAEKVIEMAPQLRQYQDEAVFDRGIQKKINDLNEKLRNAANSREPQIGALVRDAIAALTPDIEVSKLNTIDRYNPNMKTDPPFGCNSGNGNNKELLWPYRIANTIYQDGDLYLLLWGSRKEEHYASIARFRMPELTLNMVSAWSGPINPNWRNGLQRQFAVSGNLAAVTGHDRIYLFPLDGGPVREINDLPAKNVMAVAIMKDRLYAFIGREGPGYSFASETVLFSCKIDGSDRQIHISTLREDKQNKFDRTPFVVYQLIADPENDRLLFVCGTSKSGPPAGQDGINGFWEFFPTSGTGNCLINYRYFCGDINIVGDDIYLGYIQASAKTSQSHENYNIKTGQTKIVFRVTWQDAMKRPTPEPAYLYGNITSLFARPRQLWFCENYLVRLLISKDVNKTPLIILPEFIFKIFPHSDGESAIAISDRNIYKITPKETGDK
ncbi:MAG: hypothetical protein WC637_04665 [Victivallales bacterium]|jgi:hypothetical protein